MKAAERKELQTNALKQMGQELLHGGWKMPRLVWVLPILVLVVAFVYWFWAGIAANRTTNVWAYFWSARDGFDANAGAQLKGTVAELAFKLDKADRMYNQGFERLGTMPKLAIEDLQQASAEYDAIAKSSGASSLMVLNALSGAAKCEEGLGEVQRAIFYYQAVLNRFAGNAEWSSHPLVREAQRSTELLANAGSDRAQFDQNWLKDALRMQGDKQGAKPPANPLEPDPVQMPPIIPGGSPP